MTLALDTDVLVAWAMRGSPAHDPVRALIQHEVGAGSGSVGITAQVIFEFIHVVSDPRRFENPLSIDQAIVRARQFWDAVDVVRILPPPTLVHRTLELMSIHGLGRKRILDTALAATLQGAQITRLATLNRRDFEIFRFLEIVEPA